MMDFLTEIRFSYFHILCSKFQINTSAEDIEADILIEICAYKILYFSGDGKKYQSLAKFVAWNQSFIIMMVRSRRMQFITKFVSLDQSFMKK